MLARRVQHPVAQRADVACGLEVLSRAHRPPTGFHGPDCSLGRCALDHLGPRPVLAGRIVAGGGFALVLERFIPPALRRTPVAVPA